MDIFRVLSRGASLKKSREITTDFSMPAQKQEEKSKKTELDTARQVDKETDFFHVKKHKLVQGARQEEENNDNSSDEEEEKEINIIKDQDDAKKLRKSYKAKVSGDDMPLPIASFEDMVKRFKLDQRLLQNLIDSEFTEPTPIQCEAIPCALNSRDLIACAPTGSGKTLAFLIPLISQLKASKKEHGLRGLVISPTKELASQIFNEAEKLAKGNSLRVTMLSKSVAAKLKNKIISASKYDIIITTPLRLIDLVKSEALDLSDVQHIVFDEADKLFDQSFVEQTDSILSHCTNKKLRRSIFSATITSTVEELAQSIMNSPVRIIIGHKEAANSQIQQSLVFCGNEDGKLVAIRQMIQKGEFKPPVIIFLQSVVRAKALFHELLYDKLNVDVIHAERTQKQRDTVIERFRAGEIWVLICTDVMARGIDFKGVNLVINYDVPQSAQSYVHRIGRTGRGGRSGQAVTFYTKEDVVAIKPVINVMRQSGCEDQLSEWMNDMPKITKQQKIDVKRRPQMRKEITTVPKVVRQKRKTRKEMIAASKKRKTLQEDASDEDDE
ncbi:unnamed protein product [Kuraishia capsulata CBS 1993]|uniref:RNA helicase n=1 Tax=Kuraishia capsulata CBS 1993 TaxID=1382522 RepID=W6MPK1_9ASCO|nr:uncharacterized protein KUCA_T00003029001 [Kuraishia capsulata CBS 1993]CDK27052.1 unnamed protein product [Kuraishia capsulata CBS 1993]